MKKILIWSLAVLVLLLVGGALVGALVLDKAVKTAVETFGSRFTRVEVKLESVKLSLMSGGGAIAGFSVGNPQGYKSPEAIRVGSASLSLVPSSLLSDKIVVRSVNIQGPELTFEGDFNGNNLGQILENVQASAGGTGTNAPAASSGGGPSRKLQVDEFVLAGAKLTVRHTLLAGQTVIVTLPEMRFTGLGQGPEGITAAELTRVILARVDLEALKATKDAVAKGGKQAIDSAVQSGKATVEETKKTVQGVTDLFKKK